MTPMNTRRWAGSWREWFDWWMLKCVDIVWNNVWWFEWWMMNLMIMFDVTLWCQSPAKVSESSQSGKILFAQHTTSTVTSLSVSAPIARVSDSPRQVRLHLVFHSDPTYKIVFSSGGDCVLIPFTTIKRERNLIWGDNGRDCWSTGWSSVHDLLLSGSGLCEGCQPCLPVSKYEISKF